MPRNLISSDAAIRAIKPGDKRNRLSDGDGLYLLLFVKGGAHGWRFDYTHQTKRKTISLGTYPDVGLAAARSEAERCRRLVADGVDPSEERQLTKAHHRRTAHAEKVAAAGGAAPGTFRADAESWLSHQRARWSEVTLAMIRRQFEADVYPFIGARITSDLSALDVLDLAKRVEDRGAGEQASRLLQRVRSVFRHAIIHTRSISTNVTLDLQAREVLKPRAVRHRSALPASMLPEFWRSLNEYQGDPGTVNALKLLMYCVPRPGELRYTPWSELPEKAKEWRIPPERMKIPTEHIIPLSRQALEVITSQRQRTGPDKFVFPSPFYPGTPISENTLNSALTRMGYKGIATAHGFRGLFSTVCNEHDKDPDVIELCLAHVERDGVRAAYNAARKLRQRADLLQWWADYLDSKQP